MRLNSPIFHKNFQVFNDLLCGLKSSDVTYLRLQGRVSVLRFDNNWFYYGDGADFSHEDWLDIMFIVVRVSEFPVTWSFSLVPNDNLEKC